MKDKEFLIWLHYRLTDSHKENKESDYMCKLRSIIQGYDSNKMTPNTNRYSIEELE